jgi:hypothetical protein
MAELYKGKIPIIRRSLDEGFIRGAVPEGLATGCIPRDYDVDPVEMRDSPDAMTVFAESEWDALYDEQEANEDSLEHIYLRGDKPGFEFLDQNGFPDCWAHSTAHAIMLDRLKQNLPVVRLNAVAVATLLRQTNGGWCGLSMKFGRENGYPVIGTGPGQWPYLSRSGRDTPELRASMALHKATEDWYDLGRREYDQHLSTRQLATCGFNNQASAVDFNDYSHSMCQLRRVRIERGAWGGLILNSWKGFGYYGLCVIPDTTSRPDNAVAVRSSTPSAN